MKSAVHTTSTISAHIHADNAEAGIQPTDFSAKRTNDGAQQITEIDLPNLPAWHIRINALTTDFERIHLEASLDGDK